MILQIPVLLRHRENHELSFFRKPSPDRKHIFWRFLKFPGKHLELGSRTHTCASRIDKPLNKVFANLVPRLLPGRSGNPTSCGCDLPEPLLTEDPFSKRPLSRVKQAEETCKIVHCLFGVFLSSCGPKIAIFSLSHIQTPSMHGAVERQTPRPILSRNTSHNVHTALSLF